MKKFIFFITGLVFATLSAKASTSTTTTTNSFDRYTQKSFIFTENGIDFSIYQDGQFDFYINRPSCGVNVSIHRPGVNISFNAGYDYDDYVQYDDYGAVVQIIDTPIYYDYYGRVSQVGDILVDYNRYGYVAHVGGLYVRYNSRGHFLNCTGYINRFNRHYRYERNHGYFTIPSVNRCVVYTSPYRRYYNPNRYGYRTYRKHYYRNRYTKPYRSRTYYRPTDRVTHYKRGRRVSSPKYHNNRSYHTNTRTATRGYGKRNTAQYVAPKQQYRKTTVTKRTHTKRPKGYKNTVKRTHTKVVHQPTKRSNTTARKYTKTRTTTVRHGAKTNRTKTTKYTTRGRQSTQKYVPQKRSTSRSVVTTTRSRSR